MNICLFSPYVPQHIGGGEKYFFDVARLLAEKHTVSVMIPGLQTTQVGAIRERYAAFLGVSLDKVAFIDGPLHTSASWWKKVLWTRQFDVMYYLTDGSLFFSLAGKNIVHIQIPFTQPKVGWLERRKLSNWEIKNTNSYFTKQVIEKAWQTKMSVVHWPMVEVPPEYTTLDLSSKKKYILHVGRFFSHQHTKRQDVLVEFFKKLVDAHPKLTKGWKLMLVGTVDDQAYAEKVAKAAVGYPIEIVHQATRQELWKLYHSASIYWHATGYEVDETQHPERVEHFGISTVEAMALGAAPVVINKGGQPEVLGSNLTDWLWNDEAECLAKTSRLMSEPDLLSKVQQAAHKQASTFNQRLFKSKLEEMIGAAL